MKLLVFLAVLACAAADCPNFGSWREWSQCLWMQNSEGFLSPTPVRESFMEACGMSVSQPLPALALKHKITWPDKCGHCSFKMRCQNRQPEEGCFPVHIEKDQAGCNEHSAVCEVPQTPLKNCEWGMMGSFLGQCLTARPDLPAWKRDAFIKGGKLLPEMNCARKGDSCACCCHPFQPNADNTECVAVPAKPECPDMGPFNEWSECLWHPLSSMIGKMKSHCHPTDKTPPKMDLPEGLLDEADIPPPCGFCSFKIKCRNRPESKKPGCFPVEADRIACGADDCETCGQVCTLPQMTPTEELGKCDWNKKVMRVLAAKGKQLMSKMKNYYRRKGFKDIAKHLPHGSCVEVGDKCKCCCHPYEPNEDGTECVLKDICKLPSDRGAEFQFATDGL